MVWRPRHQWCKGMACGSTVVKTSSPKGERGASIMTLIDAAIICDRAYNQDNEGSARLHWRLSQAE